MQDLLGKFKDLKEDFDRGMAIQTFETMGVVNDKVVTVQETVDAVREVLITDGERRTRVFDLNLNLLSPSNSSTGIIERAETRWSCPIRLCSCVSSRDANGCNQGHCRLVSTARSARVFTLGARPGGSWEKLDRNLGVPGVRRQEAAPRSATPD